MKSKLVIESDKEVVVKSFYQWETYGGLLEGLPNDNMNRRIIEITKDRAKDFVFMEEIYLIEPKEAPIHYEGKYPFGTPAALPGITCVAELWYNDVFRDKEKMFSSLCIIWFQEDYAFPIDEEIIEKINGIPYSQICGEFDY